MGTARAVVISEVPATTDRVYGFRIDRRFRHLGFSLTEPAKERAIITHVFVSLIGTVYVCWNLISGRSGHDIVAASVVFAHV